MTEKYYYADVEKPFHVWVREGRRWVLRDAGSDLESGTGLASLANPAVERGAAARNPSSPR
jgi:hypothetical protein